MIKPRRLVRTIFPILLVALASLAILVAAAAQNKVKNPSNEYDQACYGHLIAPRMCPLPASHSREPRWRQTL